MLPSFMSSDLFARSEGGATPGSGAAAALATGKQNSMKPGTGQAAELAPGEFASMLQQTSSGQLRDDVTVQPRSANGMTGAQAATGELSASAQTTGTSTIPAAPGSFSGDPRSAAIITNSQLPTAQAGLGPQGTLPGGAGLAASGTMTGNGTAPGTPAGALAETPTTHPTPQAGAKDVPPVPAVETGQPMVGRSARDEGLKLATDTASPASEKPVLAAAAKSSPTVPIQEEITQPGAKLPAKTGTPIQAVLDPAAIQPMKTVPVATPVATPAPVPVSVPIPLTGQSPAIKPVGGPPVQNKISIAAIGGNNKAKPSAVSPGGASATAQSGSAKPMAMAPPSPSAANPGMTAADTGQTPPETLATQARPTAATPLPVMPAETGNALPSQQETVSGLRQEADLSLSRSQSAGTLDRPAAHAQRFTPQTVNQLAAQISSRFNKGNRVFDIRLDPAELGRVDVRLEMTGDQRVSAVLTVERAETLAEMQRAARDLERALNEAGLELDGDGLEFQLSEGGDGEFEDEDEAGLMNVYADADGIGLENDGMDPARPRAAYGFMLTGRDRVDVRA
jgi:flagellar hook-length control protein FliK